MAFGSILAKLESIEATTADDKVINIKNNFINKAGLVIFGVPHIGLRLRAKNIISDLKILNTNHKKVLDAGCGTGIYSFFLSDKAKEVTGIDIGEDKIDYLKKVNIFNNVHFEVGDLCKLNIPTNSFDLIICSDVLEHIKNDSKAFHELARVLKKDGRLLITTPKTSELTKKIYKKYHHERPGYSSLDYENLCQKNGLKIIKIKYFSSNFSEKLSTILSGFIYNKILLGLLFYPFYWLALISDIFSTDNNTNAIFLEITKE